MTSEVTGSAPGLYVHVPFCAAICPYCDFAVTLGGEDRRRGFVDSLEIEIARAASAETWQPFGTIYLGGGTPSALRLEELERVLSRVRNSFALTDDCWITLEANPEDTSAENLEGWRQMGVRTLSLGVQSFRDDRLQFLGRAHDAEQAIASFERARSASFHMISIDLIYGQPGQDQSGWEADLAQAVALRPEHLSCYELTIHEGTRFGHERDAGTLFEQPEPRMAEFFSRTHELLSDEGYEGYEVSSFARKPEYRSRHNQKYWRHVPYLGLGPSAHSFDGSERWWNVRSMAAWQARLEAGSRPIEARERLEERVRALETVMLSLRTRDGIDLAAFRERFGVDLHAENLRLVAALSDAGLVEVSEARLRPTRAGLAVADSLPSRFSISPPPAATS